MFKRNRHKRAIIKETNKLKSLMNAFTRAYLKCKGGKAPNTPETLSQLRHQMILALNHAQRNLKEKT